MKLINNDCIAAMKEMEDNSVDSIVTDPPYELGFMGKSWDASGIAFNVDVWREALRVLKPGGHLIAFSGSRTYHRMAVAIEDAGFEIRDQIMWVYGSGFPKSLNISKAIDKQEGNWRGKAGEPFDNDIKRSFGQHYERTPMEPPVSDEAKQWDGWGTALKPAHEPMVLARKPVEGTVANNVLTYGTGGLNIDGSRVPSDDGFEKAWDKPVSTNISAPGGKYISEGAKHTVDLTSNRPVGGRFPANFIHDGSDEVLALFPDTKSPKTYLRSSKATANIDWNPKEADTEQLGFGDSGSAARFFYCAKASKRDRNQGLDGFETREKRYMATANGTGKTSKGMEQFTSQPSANHHPTVKPTSLMQYLVRLVTPSGGVVLDPFMGSGSTGKACAYEGFDFIGIDQSAEYVEIARARIAFAQADDE
jgi:site-specific DNA-methyltransferase (adenine-specific)